MLVKRATRVIVLIIAAIVSLAGIARGQDFGKPISGEKLVEKKSTATGQPKKTEADKPGDPNQIKPGMFSYGCWIEAEDAERTNLHISKCPEPGVFSENCGLSVYSDKAPDPEGYYFAEYDIELPEDGTYNVWLHGNHQNSWVRSACKMSVDGGPLRPAVSRSSISSCAEKKKRSSFAGWTKFAKLKLSKGPHRLHVRLCPCKKGKPYHGGFDCIVFVNNRYTAWTPEITPEADGIMKPPLPEEWVDFFPNVPDGNHMIIEADFSQAPNWSAVDLLLKREVLFWYLPKKGEILIKSMLTTGGSVKAYALFEDSTGEEFGVLLSMYVPNNWGYCQFVPAGDIAGKAENLMVQGGNMDMTVDFPLRFKGVRMIARKVAKEKFALDNLIIDGRLVEDFEDITDWEVSDISNVLGSMEAIAGLPKPMAYSTSQRKEKDWGRFFVQVDTVYLASNLATLVPFEYDASMSYSPTHMQLQIDLPEGIYIAGIPHQVHWDEGDVPPVKEISNANHEGKEYTRYRVVCNYWGGWTKLASYPPMELFLKTDLKAGSKHRIYHKTVWRHGEKKEEGKEIVKPVEIIEVKETVPPESFVTGVWAPGIGKNYPTPHDFYLKMGLADLYQGIAPDMTGDLKKLGYRRVFATNIGELRPDAKATCTLIDGKTLLEHMQERGQNPQTLLPCPTYRGEAIQKYLEEASSLAKQGYDGLSIGIGEPGLATRYEIDKTCFCKRCLDRYKEFMKKKYPDMEYISPKVFEKDWKKYPEHHKIWWDFKTDMFTECMRLYVDRFKNEAVTAGRTENSLHASLRTGILGGVLNWGRAQSYMNPATGFPYSWSLYFDYKKLGEIFDVIMDQLDTVADISKVGNAVRARREMMGEDPKAEFVAVLACRYSVYYIGLFPVNVWNKNYPETYKYMLFESIANGAKGFLHLTEGTMDGLDQKGVVDVVNIVKTVEDVIMEGKLIPLESFESEVSLRIRGVGTDKEAVVMVANYREGNQSDCDVETEITFKSAVNGQNVIDLETGEVLGKLSTRNRSFPINIKQYKSRLLYIGHRKDVGLR